MDEMGGVLRFVLGFSSFRLIGWYLTYIME